MTWLDRQIARVAPGYALRRTQDRLRLEALNQAYTAADISRRELRGWNPAEYSADSATIPNLRKMRTRSRDLSRNDPIGSAAISRTTTSAINWGLIAKPQINGERLGLSPDQQAAREAEFGEWFQLWADDLRCDVTEAQNFRELQDLALRSTLESGDVFVLPQMIERDSWDWPFTTSLQLYEADQIENPGGLVVGDGLAVSTVNGNRIYGGIETNPVGAPVAVHIRNTHPGSQVLDANSLNYTRVPIMSATGARQVWHLMAKRRPGQHRGVPMLAPVMLQIKQLNRYCEAELAAAVVAAMFTVFMKTEGKEPLIEAEHEAGKVAKQSDDELRMGNAAIVPIGLDEEIEIANPGRPNQAFDTFFQAVVREIGAGLEIPYEVLMMSFTASYSASRASIELAYQFFRRWRWWIEARLCWPAYAAVIAEGVATGRLAAPGFFEDPAIRRAWLGCMWIAPRQVVIRPDQEFKAKEIAEDRGWQTTTEITAEVTGGDWDRKHEQRRREEQKRREAGLSRLQNGSVTAPGDQADETDQPDPDIGGDTEDETQEET